MMKNSEIKGSFEINLHFINGGSISAFDRIFLNNGKSIHLNNQVFQFDKQRDRHLSKLPKVSNLNNLL